MCEKQAFAAHWWAPANLGVMQLKTFPLQISQANVSPQLSFFLSQYLFAHYCQPEKQAEAH